MPHSAVDTAGEDGADASASSSPVCPAAVSRPVISRTAAYLAVGGFSGVPPKLKRLISIYRK
ncbi:MAG: hypothetical protein HYV63_11825 [Candidatus Schekmanbacteria bacterium]|nr:hypothetical protein [Candidatus Schekmanbacteria bacterium]